MLQLSDDFLIIGLGGKMKTLKILVMISVFCVGVSAWAQSPMTTVLHKPRVAVAENPQNSTGAMVRNFAACSPSSALPKSVLAPLGVAFLDSKQAAAVKFAYPDLLKDRSNLLLVANDPSNMETTADGRFLIYGGKYRLKKSIVLAERATLRAVAEMIAVGPPRSRVGVSYTFDKPIKGALASLEATHDVELISRIDRLPMAETAKVSDAWITLGDDGKSVTCWRFVD